MVFFRRQNEEHINLAKDCYNPCYLMESFKVSQEFLAEFHEGVLEGNYDLVFLIMMSECPEEVKVDLELREHTLQNIFGYDHSPTHDEIESEIYHRHPNKYHPPTPNQL